MKQYDENMDMFPLSKIKTAKKNAEVRGIEWRLTSDDISNLLLRANGRCELTGHPFGFVKDAKRQPWTPSIDRIDSTKWYFFENCRLVCVIVNYALNEFGDHVFWEMVSEANSPEIASLKDYKKYQRAVVKPREELISSVSRASDKMERLQQRIADLEARLEFMERSGGGVSINKIEVNKNLDENGFLDTDGFARLNSVKPETVRSAYCRQGFYCGIRPTKLKNRRLVWPAVRVTP